MDCLEWESSFEWTCRKGSLGDIIRFEPTADNIRGTKAFMLACRGGHQDVLEWLVKKADLTRKDTCVQEAFANMCTRGGLVIARWLRDTLGITADDAYTPLTAAYRQENTRTADWLTLAFELSEKTLRKELASVFLEAAARGDTNALRRMHGAAGYKAKDNCVRDAFEAACERGDTDTAKCLRNACDISSYDLGLRGYRVLVAAYARKDRSTVQWIWQNFRDLHYYKSWALISPAFHHAWRRGDRAYAESIADGYKYCDGEIRGGWSDFTDTLEYICRAGRVDDARYFANTHGITLDDLLRGKCSSFLNACARDDLPIVRWMVEEMLLPEEYWGVDKAREYAERGGAAKVLEWLKPFGTGSRQNNGATAAADP